MIVSKDITPNKNLYYVGALVIEVLKKQNTNKLDIIEVYKEVNKKENISMSLLLFSFDWLFMIDILNIEDEEIKICL